MTARSTAARQPDAGGSPPSVRSATTTPPTRPAQSGRSATRPLKTRNARLATRLQIDKQLIGLVGEDKSTGSFNQISAEDYARIVDA
ncbi:MAG TPA: hypothetical protein VJT31_00195, partial [Rugosimonospora sp.]|nr:hypothetical protein [Rugosimonospora sp.]